MSQQMVDWQVARATAERLVKAGPEISAAGAAEAVASLRASAVVAERHVSEVTGLVAPSGSAPVLVVDRPGWIGANVDAFRTILAPLGSRAEGQPLPTSRIGARVSGVEVGAMLAFLAPKILGQFDPFHDGGPHETGGRLLLVAPNVVHVERELDVDPEDFRLWVCLHEETHRVQFTAVPWLRDHLRAELADVVADVDLDSGALVDMVRHGAVKVARGIRGTEEVSIVDLVQTPSQRDTIEHITAVMSLLEGHADVVMDRVGPDIVPSVRTIRKRFNARRAGRGPDRLLRKLLGLDAKMRQYRDGAAFCRAVIDRVGMEGFNRVFESPEALPTMAEITDPQSWVSRVHGTVEWPGES